jgi:sulfatase maturation enzyme AslB (radical SAM superfamily)
VKFMTEEIFVSSVLKFTHSLRFAGESKARISIYGGEPFTNKATVFRAIEKLGPKQNGVSLDWVINTNGSLITAEDAKFLKKQNIEIHLSIDGGKESHNKSRRTLGGQETFDRVIKGLNLLREAGVRTQFNSHLMPSNIENLIELVDLAAENEIKKIYLDLSYTPMGMDVPLALRKYRQVYYYGIKRGVSILGSWSEVSRNLQLPKGRKSLIEKKFGIEVNVDGTYFFPTWINSKNEPKIFNSVDVNLNSEIEVIRAQLAQEYDRDCQHCALFKSCYGVAKEHVRYHLNAQADSSSYCDFFRQWIADLERPISSLKTESFLVTSSAGPVSHTSALLQDLRDVDLELAQNFPRLRALKKTPIHVHISQDFDEFSAIAGDLEVPAWARLYARDGRLVICGEIAPKKSAIRHELVHVLIQNAKVTLPAWFEEGVCQAFSIFGGSQKADWLSTLRQISARKTNGEVERELLAHPAEPLIHLGDQPLNDNLYYQHGLTLVCKMIEAEYHSQINKFWEFIDELPLTPHSGDFPFNKLELSLT